MSLYEESRPRSKYLLGAHSPALGQNVPRVQVVSDIDDGSVLIQSRLENAQFLGATLTRQHWSQVDVVTSELSATEFIDCTLSQVKFEDCTLNEVTFRGCFLEGLQLISDGPANLYFENCTVIDPEGVLARLETQGRLRNCVISREGLKKSEPKRVPAAPAPAPLAKAPQTEQRAESLAPSRFDKLEV